MTFLEHPSRFQSHVMRCKCTLNAERWLRVLTSAAPVYPTLCRVLETLFLDVHISRLYASIEDARADHTYILAPCRRSARRTPTTAACTTRVRAGIAISSGGPTMHRRCRRRSSSYGRDLGRRGMHLVAGILYMLVYSATVTTVQCYVTCLSNAHFGR